LRRNLVTRKSIGFQILSRTNYVPSLVKIHWRMLILGCSQGMKMKITWILLIWCNIRLLLLKWFVSTRLSSYHGNPNRNLYQAVLQ
jgi:hypothetical protein